MTYRKDKLEIIDEQENILGIEERGKIHQEGLLHKEVHVWLYTPKGELIFQHRGPEVETYPDMLDATVGGHVEIGDSFEETAIKELEEETGIKTNVEDLILLDKFINISHDQVTGKTNKSLKAEYAYPFSGTINDLAIEKGKSLGFELLPIERILRPTKEDQARIINAFFSDNFKNVFKQIQKLI